MSARRSDNEARVLVFIDGQNVFKTCQELWGHGFCHPLLLAQRVVAGRRLVGVRYYTGIHDPRIRPDLNAVSQRRHALMRRLGITVVERLLRYRWEWGFDQKTLPNPFHHQGEERTVIVKPYQRAREKGVDTALALDLADLALQDLMDVAVVLSRDQDLTEAAKAVHQTTRLIGRRVSVEAAVFNEQRAPILLPHYDFTHQLKRADFEAASDSFDYRQELNRPMADLFVQSCAGIIQRA